MEIRGINAVSRVKLLVEVLEHMSKLKFSKGKFSRFISSKGFYVALAVCLVGASAATWMAVDRTITGIENQNTDTLRDRQENPFVIFPPVEDVEQKAPDVPIERPGRSAPQPSSSTSSSSSEESSRPPAPSTPQRAPVTSQPLVYALPVRGEIAEPFSNGELIKNHTLGDWRTHDGMDIYAERGTDILAAANGTVEEIRNDPLWGTAVTISHSDGNQTIYSGLQPNIPVNVGDVVTVRQAIGKLDGVPGEMRDSRPHLHFAVRRDGKWINPMDVLGGEPRD